MRCTRSALLDSLAFPVAHGYSTRRGGVSAGRYESLNLGRSWGDDPGLVDENHRLLARDGGFDAARLVTVKQVHGGVCLRADEGADDPVSFRAQKGDALVATHPGVAVGIYTADCVPILFSDGEGRVGAAHAGWRGTVCGIAAITVEALVSVGADVENIRAALGPSIGPCCFEVGEEVAAEFERLGIAGSVVRPGGPNDGKKPHVDLWTTNRVLLERAGLAADRIEASPPCTMCRGDLYFSFRRDGVGIGQMMSFIVAGVAG